MKKRCIFSQCRSFIQRGDPHETMYFTIWKLLLHFLSSCVLFLKSTKNWLQNSSHNFTLQKRQKVVPGTHVGYPHGPELTLESPKIHKMLQKRWFLTLPFFKQISRHKKTHFGQFLVSKWEVGRHEPGPMGREPERRVPPSLEGDHHVTKWSWVECGNLGYRGTPSPGLKPRGGFQRLRLMPPPPYWISIPEILSWNDIEIWNANWIRIWNSNSGIPKFQNCNLKS